MGIHKISVKTKFNIGDTVWCLDYDGDPFKVGKIKAIQIEKTKGKATYKYLAGRTNNPFEERELRLKENQF